MRCVWSCVLQQVSRVFRTELSYTPLGVPVSSKSMGQPEHLCVLPRSSPAQAELPCDIGARSTFGHRWMCISGTQRD